MSVVSRSLKLVIAFIVVFASFVGAAHVTVTASGSITYGSSQFGAINSSGASLSDSHFTFTGGDSLNNNSIGIDEDGIYLTSNNGNPSNAASGIVHINSKNASNEFTIRSINVNAQVGKNVTFEVRFNNTGSPVETITISNSSSNDSTSSGFNYKRITFSAPTSVRSVDITITDNSAVKFVGSNASIVDFVIDSFPAPPTITNYILTYAAGSGGTLTGTLSQTVASGGSGTAVTAVPNTNYRFVNWSDGETAATRTDSNVTGNKSLTANFALNQYTLTYTAGANGTLTGTTPQTVNPGSDGTAVTANPAVHYHFVNWSDNVLTATRTDTNVLSDLNVTANFALDTYTLSYAAGANGTLMGTAIQAVGYNLSGSAVTAVPNANYHFVNWSDGETTATRTDTNVTANKSLTANFALNEYTLSYTAGVNGTLTGTSPQTVNHGSDGTVVTAVPAAGYHFVKWSDNIATATRTDTNVQGGLNVTAIFAIDTYALTYTAGTNGTLIGIASQTIDRGSDGTAVTAVPNTGYHFVNWSDTKTTATRTDTNVLGDLSVTANFAINEYTLSYTAGANGTLTGTSPQTVNHGSDGTAVTAVPDTGYHFVKWSDNIATATRTDTNVQGGLNVTAIFAIDTYALTYTAGTNGTLTGIASQTIDRGSDGTAVTAVPNTGYHFVSWSDTKTTATRTDTNVLADLSVTANFAINEYTLSYTAGANGTLTGTSPQTVNHGSDGTAVTAVPDTGYHFVKWSDNIATATRTDTNMQSGLTVTAIFAIDTYALTYTAGTNGTLTGIASQTIDRGSDGTAVTAVPNTGYHFVNWSDTKTTTTRTDTNVLADLSVTANFAINEYTLTYTTGTNGTLTGTSPQTVNHGSDGTAVTAVPDTGYHFVKWSDNVATATRTDTNVQEALQVTANFAPDTHTLNYTAGANGTLTGTSSQTIEHGSDGSAVTAVPDSGYHFVDWSDGLTTATRTDANVFANVTVSANFAINEYTLSYTAGLNGTLSGTLLQTVQHGSDGATVTAVAYGGYHFVGWSDGKATAVRTDMDVQSGLSVTANFDEDDQPAPSVPLSGGGAAISGNKDVIVLVNGKAQNAGVATTTQVNNQTVTTISVNEKIIEEKIAQEGQNAKITIPVSSKSDVVVGQLSGDIIKKMEQSQATIEMATERATYTVPVEHLQLDKVISKLGQPVNLQELQLQIAVAEPTKEMVGTVVKASDKGEFTLLVPPVEFTIQAIYEGQTIEITHFNAYVERTIALPEDVDPLKITTGIVVEPDGTVRHVPTKVIVIEGKYYAQVSSLTNSTYSIVWHPITFSDMTEHWAKDSVNEMGSRMVTNGVNDQSFAPDQDISRAEFAAVIVRALGLKLDSGSAPFSDVKAADWYNEVIQTAYNYGLINGFEDGTFRPTDKITREQAAVIIAKAMGITALKNKLAALSSAHLNVSFQDGEDVSQWAVSALMDCLASGIVTGRAEQILAPKAYITRAEVAVMTQRLLQKSELI